MTDDMILIYWIDQNLHIYAMFFINISKYQNYRYDDISLDKSFRPEN